MARAPLPVGTWGSVSVRRRGSAWQASTRYRAPDGTTRQVRAQGRTKGTARAALARTLADLKGRVPAGQASTATTLSQACEDWLAWMEATKRVRAQTLARYRAIVSVHVVPALGALHLGEVTPALLQDHLLRTTEGQRRHVRMVLSQVFRHARRNGLMLPDPVEPTVLPRTQRREPDALDGEQVAALRRAVREWGSDRTFSPRPSPVLACAVDLMLGTGMRVGEVCALEWDDVDLRAATVSVRATLTTLDSKAVRQEATKTERSTRTLHLPPFCVAALVELGPRESGPVLVTRNGTHLLPANLRRSLRAATQHLDFQVTPHTLRRTLATVLEREVDVKTAADQLGHTDPAITGRHYVARTHEGPDVGFLIERILGEENV
ncbi:tyrosine-type recombinase/integrase [Actinomyces urogenitalis]|uniref:tyrosine-type recombinase/integrase n=1 Tax=Actinomyces urogenitalis TaxID=103621 RepID=UPI00242B9E76|nr:site-specific integrase [Actinomyces urogenitalis]MCI7457617.1 site-specific integrase [Actinomyces urogenitalis]